jgi:hypothetical protein
VEIRWGPPRGPTVRRCECDRIWMAGLVGSSVGASWFGGTMKLGLSITIGNPRLLIYILYTYMYIYTSWEHSILSFTRLSSLFLELSSILVVMSLTGAASSVGV